MVKSKETRQLFEKRETELSCTCTLVGEIAIFEGYEETFYLSGIHLKEGEDTAHVAQTILEWNSVERLCLEDTLNFVLSIPICFHLRHCMS